MTKITFYNEIAERENYFSGFSKPINIDLFYKLIKLLIKKKIEFQLLPMKNEKYYIDCNYNEIENIKQIENNIFTSNIKFNKVSKHTEIIFEDLRRKNNG